MRSSGQPMETDREVRREPTDLHPGLCLPWPQLPDDSPNVRTRETPRWRSRYSANPAHAMTWLKVSPVEILPGESASIPVTRVVPSNPGSVEAYVTLRRGVPISTSGSASGHPSARVRRGRDKPPPGTSPLVFLWLIVLVVIVLVAFWVRRRLAGRE